ncbi:hypothetical protein GE061_004971 [Apolygus lucorum]|uniref:Uncharacterized protein n=1 Tax=Apolygus lucorum TaxID=248454 RepID=A0A6A4IQU6_APOLU|nr:hypothetical protein GE061_004971 [Apolygus lucorum]
MPTYIWKELMYFSLFPTLFSLAATRATKPRQSFQNESLAFTIHLQTLTPGVLRLCIDSPGSQQISNFHTSSSMKSLVTLLAFDGLYQSGR